MQIRMGLVSYLSETLAAKTEFLVNKVLFEVVKRNELHKKRNITQNVPLFCLTFLPLTIQWYWHDKSTQKLTLVWLTLNGIFQYYLKTHFDVYLPYLNKCG